MQEVYLAKVGASSAETVDASLTGHIATQKANGYIEVTENIDPFMTVQADGSWSLNIQLLGQAVADAMQEHMDETAKLFGFKHMDRAVGYINSVNLTFKGYAEILSAFRDAWWEYSEGEEAKVLAGTRTMPTIEEMFAELELAHATPTI